jgi:hypothetical protein
VVRPDHQAPEYWATTVAIDGAKWLAEQISEWVYEPYKNWDFDWSKPQPEKRSPSDAPLAQYCELMPKEMWGNSWYLRQPVGLFRRLLRELF